MKPPQCIYRSSITISSLSSPSSSTTQRYFTTCVVSDIRPLPMLFGLRLGHRCRAPSGLFEPFIHIVQRCTFSCLQMWKKTQSQTKSSLVWLPSLWGCYTTTIRLTCDHIAYMHSQLDITCLAKILIWCRHDFGKKNMNMLSITISLFNLFIPRNIHIESQRNNSWPRRLNTKLNMKETKASDLKQPGKYMSSSIMFPSKYI